MTSPNYRGLTIPFTRMGNVTSDDLFGPNEQVIFDFYEASGSRYERALDIGANIGVHSILMARQGWEVRAFEPDPTHFGELLGNVAAHDVDLQVSAVEAAVSDHDGVAEFTRVLDNTTGSHLAGAKASYGPRTSFSVEVVDCRPLFEWADFAKIDCEGHEAVLMQTTTPSTWAHMSALLEVGSYANAVSIYDHLRDVVSMWSQKTGWQLVRSLSDMPCRHQDGSLFIGYQPPFRSNAA
jgi:FkbM family methyltransferase